MEKFIDTAEGNIPSLADSDEYIEVTRALASLGLMRDMNFHANGLAAAEARDFAGNNEALFQETVRAVDLMREFSVVATGIGFDGDAAFTGLVIANPDEETAEFNAKRLVDRVWNVPVSTRTSNTLADQLRRVEVAVDRKLVLARFYFRDFARHLYGFPLLLNNTLTVEVGQAGSHAGRGWDAITDACVSAVVERGEACVFILWGSHARKKAGRVRGLGVDGSGPEHHLVLTSPHPSPLSAHRGFFGSRPFSQANAFLEQHGRGTVDWAL